MNKWGEFCDCDRYALKYFQWMQARVKSGYCETDMTNDREGYIKFCLEVGPIPTEMVKPSIGRIDHRRGYVEGNFRWQEWIENCRDNDRAKISSTSKQTASRMWSDPAMKERLLEKLRSPEKRKKQSEMMKGNKNASGKRSPEAIANIKAANIKAGVARARLAKMEKKNAKG